MIRALLLLLLLLAAPASAEERRFVVTNFDRLRVDGAFDVQVTTQGSPGALVEGPAAATDQVDIRVEGTTLIVRSALRQSGERATPPRAPVKVRLVTPDLRSATVIGGGRVELLGVLKAPRLDVQVTGSGALVARGIATDQLNVVLLGAGSMALGGHAGRLRVSVSGAGAFDGVALVGNDLILRLDGPGSATVGARYTADVLTTGIGAATVLGSPSCKVKAQAGGPITCSKLSAP